MTGPTRRHSSAERPPGEGGRGGSEREEAARRGAARGAERAHATGAPATESVRRSSAVTRASSGRHASRARAGEVAPTQTIPIAAKYAGITAILLVLSLYFVARSDLGIAVATADDRINQNGIQLAAMFAEEIEPFWAIAGRSGADNQRAQAELQELLRSRVADPSLADDVLDVVVIGIDRRSFLASASGGQKMILEGARSLETDAAKNAGVEIRTGFLSVHGESRRARFFERKMLHEGREVGAVQVFLSAAAIDRLGDELFESVITNVLIALGIGMPVVLFVGTMLTRPIRELKRDMATVAQGDLEHQSAVRSHDELGSLAAAFNRMTHQLAEAQEQEVRRQSLERELSIATSIQSALLPEKVPQIRGYELASHYVSAKEVGGDYYDFIPLGGGRIGIVVADVSGKGIPGSLVMTMTRALLRMAAHAHERVGEMLGTVNENLSRDMTRGMFVTMLYVAFDPASGRLQIGRAGHNPAYLYQTAPGTIGLLQPGVIALGMDPGEVFRQSLQVGEVTLAPGDFLVLYTDGVTEAMDAGGNEYTPERFVEVLEAAKAGSAAEIVAAVIEDLARHTGGAEQSDDVTMLVLKRTG